MEAISQTLSRNVSKSKFTMELVTVENWLKRLLHRKELPEPDGQPLYQYHVTEPEFIQLQNILKICGEPKVTHVSTSWCAAFCIYCAEWYRRAYMGGWSWAGIWNSLEFKIEANNRQYVIEKGLNGYWNRPVSHYNDKRSSYLGSVFKEGGLPYGLLASEGNRFQRIFKRILSSFDDASAFGLSSTQLVSEYLESLPEAFKQETTVKLISKMAELLLYLTDEYNLDQQAKPASYLDDNLPGWRGMFPIPLDGNAGSEFLSGLLTSASSQQRDRKKRDKRIDCQQWLADKSNIEFCCRVQLAKKLDMLFERKDLVNNRVEFFVYEGNSVIAEVGVGHIDFTSERAQVILWKNACQFTRKNLDDSLYLLVFQAGKVLHREEIINSEIRLGGLPVILKKSGDRNLFLGAGTCNICSEELSVLLPLRARIDHTQTNKFEQHSLAGMNLILFSGKLIIELNEENEIDRYLVSSISSSSKNELVNIRGDTLPFNLRNGQPVFLGLPKISTGEISTQLLIGGKPVGSDFQASIYGLQTVKSKAINGNILYHKRLAILPKDFVIKLVPSDLANVGSIELRSSSNFTVNILDTKLIVKNISTDFGKRLDLSVSSMPPKEILLKITPNLLADPIIISVPFPTTGVLGFDNDGHKLSENLVLEDLLGSRLQLFPKLGTLARYKLELSCAYSRRAYYLWEYLVYDQPLEINLYELRHYIRELLAVGGKLDDQVRLEISGSCKTKKYTIARYSTEAKLENYCIRFDVNIENYSAIKAEMLDLTNPSASPCTITQKESQGVALGIFELPRKPDYPSLIVPTYDSKLYFRACYIAGKKKIENPFNVSSLQKATAVSHIMQNAIDLVFDQMIYDFNHSGWQFLKDLESNFSYLPMATFDVWKKLVARKDMLAALVISSDNSISLMRRLQVEFNVIWELIPLHIWQEAVKCYSQMMIDEGYPKKIKNKLIAAKFDDLAEVSPLFESEPLYLVTNEDGKDSNISKEILSIISKKWAQNLINLHSNDSRWPTAFSYELEAWVKGNCKDLVCFTIPMGYQNAVMLFPFFAAAVVAGKAELSDVCKTNTWFNNFFLRQLIEFDRQWFIPMFKQLLCIIVKEGL